MNLHIAAHGEHVNDDGESVTIYAAMVIDPATQVIRYSADYNPAALDAAGGGALRSSMNARFSNVGYSTPIFAGIDNGKILFLAGATGCNVGDARATVVLKLLAVGAGVTVLAQVDDTVALPAVADSNTLLGFVQVGLVGGDIYVAVSDSDSPFENKTSLFHLAAGIAERGFIDGIYAGWNNHGAALAGSTAYLVPGAYDNDGGLGGYVLQRVGNVWRITGTGAGVAGDRQYAASAQAAALAAAGITPDTLVASTRQSAGSRFLSVRGQNPDGSWLFSPGDAYKLTNVLTGDDYTLQTLLQNRVGFLRGDTPALFSVSGSDVPVTPSPSFWDGVIGCDVGGGAVAPIPTPTPSPSPGDGSVPT